MAHDAFISHSTENRVIANAVCATLEKRNIRCWIAPRDIHPGVDYGEALVEAIEDSRALVLILTAHANQSGHVRREIERAVSKGIPIIPLRVEDVTLTKSLEYFLGSIHWLDALSPPLEQHLELLAETIHRLLPDRSAPPARPADRDAAGPSRPTPKGPPPPGGGGARTDAPHEAPAPRVDLNPNSHPATPPPRVSVIGYRSSLRPESDRRREGVTATAFAPESRRTAPLDAPSPGPVVLEPLPTGQRPITHASLGSRAAAFLIDALVIAMMSPFSGLIVVAMIYQLYHLAAYGSVDDRENYAPSFMIIVVLISFMITFVGYFAVIEGSWVKATPGKQLMELGIVGVDGNRISLGRAFSRSLGKALSFLSLGLGLLIAEKHPRKQALHDQMAGTLVIKLQGPRL